MAVYKNQTSQKIAVFAVDATGAPKTGDAAQITAQISKDGGECAATNDTNPTELDATDAPGVYLFDMEQAETNGNLIVLQAKSSTSGVVIRPVIAYTEPSTRQADVAAFGGTAVTARDIGASVLLSSGTGTGQVSLSSGTVTVGTNNDKTGFSLAATGLDLVLVSSTFVASLVAGVWDKLLTGITAVGSVGLLIKTNLDAAITSRHASGAAVAKSPATLASGDVTGNVPVDVKAYTVQPTVTGATLAADQAVNVTKIAGSTVDAASAQIGVNVVNWKGSAASAMTGDAYARLGVPAGASVSADIAAVKTQTAAIETDTQDLQTQVGTDGAGLTAIGDTRMANLDATVSSRLAPAGTLAVCTTLTNLPAATADWLTAAAVKADAVTKIQNGLATPTNITAGTITTVTNLTNAPTSGDLTATMKASVTAAVPTAATIKTALEADGSMLEHLHEMTEDDGGTRRLTANALEEAPSGTSGGGDATEANQTTIINHLTDIKGTGFVKDTNSLVNVTAAGTEITIVEESTVIQD